MGGVFDLTGKLCSKHGSISHVNLYGSVLGTVWIYMVNSLEIFTELSVSSYCRSAFNQNKLVDGDYHMERASILS